MRMETDLNKIVEDLYFKIGKIEDYKILSLSTECFKFIDDKLFKITLTLEPFGFTEEKDILEQADMIRSYRKRLEGEDKK